MSNIKTRSLTSRQGRICALFSLTRNEAKDFSGMNVIMCIFCCLTHQHKVLKLGQELNYTFVQAYSRFDLLKANSLF